MKKYLVVLALMLPLVTSAQTASSTVDLLFVIKQLQTQIQLLQTQVTDLQSQIQSVKTELKFTRFLAKGASGDDVKQLQEFLKSFPDIYPEGLVTGYYGPLTEIAVKKLQEKQGLEVVGIVGPKTLERLNLLTTTDTGNAQSEPTTTSATKPSAITATANVSAPTPSSPILGTITGIATTTPACIGNYSTCSSKSACESAKFFWYTVSCHPNPAPSSSCAASYNYCPVGPECAANGWYSCRNSCYGSPDACLGQTYLPPAVPTSVGATTSSSGSGVSGTGVTTTTTTTIVPTAQTTTTTSTTATGTTSDTTAPSVPTSLNVFQFSTSQLNLSWTASTDNVGVFGYKIYRDGTQISTTAAGATSTIMYYSNTGLQAGTAYTYAVVAYDVAGNNSAQSTSVTTTTQSPPPPPSPPTAVSCSPTTISGGGIKVGIYLIDGRTSMIYGGKTGTADCRANSAQQIQWVTCVEALSGRWLYPTRDNLSYSYTVKDPSGTIVDSGSWKLTGIDAMNSCPTAYSEYTLPAYSVTNLKSDTDYTIMVSGTSAGEPFSSSAVFRTLPSVSMTTSTSNLASVLVVLNSLSSLLQQLLSKLSI